VNLAVWLIARRAALDGGRCVVTNVSRAPGRKGEGHWSVPQMTAAPSTASASGAIDEPLWSCSLATREISLRPSSVKARGAGEPRSRALSPSRLIFKRS
jgi:hypothetical protein